MTQNNPPLFSGRIPMLQINEHFKLSEDFIEGFKGKQPEWGPLGYVVYKRTYARPVEGTDRTEEWWETIRRVVEGCYTVQLNHCARLRLPWNKWKAQKSAQTMYKLMWEFKFLPAGRGLWAMGTKVMWERGAACLYNCSFISTGDISKSSFAEPFCFLADMSMFGVGVAFDTNGAGKVIIKEPKIDGVFVVPDSREGWVEVIRRVLMGYMGEQAPSSIDYSLIRPKGSEIKTFGGIAPGPAPLIECIDNIHQVLRPRIGSTISSVDIVDLMNVIAKCVVSGGIRRSASLGLGYPEDIEYMSAKDPVLNSELLSKWRWASNNTVIVKIGQNYHDLAEQAAKNGEPGFFWIDNARSFGRMKDPANNKDRRILGMNPCGEISLESGELCNIADTFPSRHDTYEEYRLTLKYAYLYLKTVTLLSTHDERTNSIQLRNRRVGLSQTGIVESFVKHGRATHFDWCDRGYEYIRQLDMLYSEWLCVPQSVKYTTTKPSGSVSLLPGVTPGIHYPHSEYYYRTIRIDPTSSLLEPLRKAGYRIEESACGDNTFVVYFPVHEKYFERAKKDVSIWEQMENAAAIQHFWSDNQVSVTVTFRPEEVEDIEKVLDIFQYRLKSVSFCPLKDHGFIQAPYQEITKEEYERAMESIKPLSLSESSHEITEKGCTNDSCAVDFDRSIK